MNNLYIARQPQHNLSFYSAQFGSDNCAVEVEYCQAQVLGEKRDWIDKICRVGSGGGRGEVGGERERAPPHFYNAVNPEIPRINCSSILNQGVEDEGDRYLPKARF